MLAARACPSIVLEVPLSQGLGRYFFNPPLNPKLLQFVQAAGFNQLQFSRATRSSRWGRPAVLLSTCRGRKLEVSPRIIGDWVGWEWSGPGGFALERLGFTRLHTKQLMKLHPRPAGTLGSSFIFKVLSSDLRKLQLYKVSEGHTAVVRAHESPCALFAAYVC